MPVLEKIYHDKLVIQELRQSVLGKYIDDFALYLQELGYSKKKFRSRLTVIRKLSTWLTKNSIGLYDLNQEKINQFIKLRARQSTAYLKRGDRKTLSYFIDYLRRKKIIPQLIPATPENEAIENIIQSYIKYLDEDKGLSALTITRNKRFIYDFLYKNFGKNKFTPKKITQSLILLYIIKFKERHAVRNLQVMVSILRSFLRYLVMIGNLSVQLANCIPAMPSHRAANLPVFLVKSETKKLLKTCDRRTSNGRRNYAILLLLMRLGLRASEVLNLTLDNINWDLGELEISGKGRKHRVLPLSNDIGKALTSYICYARPKCLHRQVFICSRAPHKGLGNPSSISTIVRRALIAAGLKPQQMGAHLLRYTAATETLSKGATLFEIGELLGHRSIDTTAIYTKIDVVALRELAKPWPIK
ncbi:MAG: tyrosine-type recombinase/integrase [Proteobacteria bacterium]|nr:tyrosine-type recombinase/integrase [Pseudomonadota bacterium]